jgi:hypothetical protein
MSYASLRRHATAPVIAALLTMVPLGATAVAAQAAPAPATSVAPATKPVAVKQVAAPAKPAVKKLSPKAKHKLAVKKAAAKKKAKPKSIAHSLVENKYKWSHRQYTCLKKLWSRESGWRVKADNPSSSAYGIPQALPGHKMGKGWKSSAKTQIRWGLRYIDKRYDTPCAADRFQRSHGWY